MAEKPIIPETDWNEVSGAVDAVLPKYARGPRPTVRPADIVVAKVRQKLSTADSVEEHLEDFTGVALQDSTDSRRLRKLCAADLERVSDALLGPRR